MRPPNSTANYICKLTYLFTFLLLLCATFDLSAQQKAFPTAYGGGAYASGGRGGNVYHVTNLNDPYSTYVSGSNTLTVPDTSSPDYIGSFRWALSQPRPATIVFDVSGVLVLSSALDFNGNDLTIAGQSAPVGGITISEINTYPADANTYVKRFRLRTDTDNLIMRHIRVRPVSEGGDDAFESYTNSSITNVMYDHLSVSYGGDEGFSMRVNPGGTIHNITFQRSILAENKTGSLFGTSWDGTVGQSTITNYNMSWLNNLSFNNSHRSPNLTSNGRFDWINNVVHNWEDHIGAMYGDLQANLINNYFSLGERSTLIGNRARKEAWSIDEDSGFTPEVYIAGNIADKSQLTDPNADNWFMVWRWKSPTGPNDYRVDPANVAFQSNTQFTQIGAEMPIQSAVDAYNDVRTDSGANASLNADGSVTYYTDTQDTEYLNTIATEGDFIHYNQYDQFKPYDYNPTFATFKAEVEALAGNPTPVNTRPNDYYISNSHIPEIWFLANVPTGEDHNDLAPNGYTWLEVYLNGVDVPSIAIGVESVDVTPNTAELELIETLQLTASFTPSNATNQDGVWSSSDELIATVDENGMVIPVSIGVVTITFTTNDGGYTDTSEITVFPEALQASAGEDKQICEGESATLTASGGTNYVWSTGDTTASIEVTPDDTTIYTVTVSDNSGQSEEASVTITVNLLPIADAGEDQTICEGELITLTATGGTSYLWSSGETTASIEVNPVLETTYDVEVISNNCSSTDSVTIYVNDAPDITVTEDAVIVEGQSTTLTASGGDNYNWSNGEITESINVSPITTTTYTVSSLGVNGCSGNVDVTVTVIPEIIADAGEDITICSGDVVSLNASGGVIYSWDTGDTGSELIVNPTITTTYTVTAEDDYGYTDTDSVTIFVNEIPEISVDEDIYIMIGNSATLAANGGDTYSWSTGETTASISVSPDLTTTYTVTGFLANGCQSTAEVLVTVVEELNANAGEDVSICIGSNVTLSASGGITYTWNTGETGASPTFNPAETTTYTVTVTDGFGNSDSDDVIVTVNPIPIAFAGEDQTVCEGETVILTAEGGDSYLWSTGDTSATITVNPTTDIIYTVEVFSNNCSDSDDVTVFTIPTPNITISEDITIMTGSSATLVVNGGDTYLWNTGDTSDAITVNPTETTTYTVTSFIENGCQSSAQVTVTVIPELIANAGEDVSICSGDSVTLDASGGVAYIWNTGDANASPTFSPAITTTYTVTVTDGFGNSDSDSVTITVNDLPTITISENIIIIEGESTNLVASGAETYQWNTGETSSNIAVNPLQTTTYTVTGTSNTCSVQAQVTVIVEELFVASAGADERVCDNDSYEVLLTANQGDSYLWNTGETTQSIVVSPLSTITYNVTVTQGEQEDTDEVTVYVDPSPNVEISNGESVEILNGDFITLTASGANNYSWNNGATQPNIAVSPSTTTTYGVTGYIGDCYDEKEVIVNVLQPVVADAGEDVSICLDETATLTATGGDEYVWSTGETTPTILVTPIETTEYTVTVFNALDFDEASVTVGVDANCEGDPVEPEDDLLDFNFNIFPNPARNTVNVKLSGTILVSDLYIYDLTGKLVKQTEILNENLSPVTTTQINIRDLQSGVYFVKLIDKDRDITKKLIVE